MLGRIHRNTLWSRFVFIIVHSIFTFYVLKMRFDSSCEWRIPHVYQHYSHIGLFVLTLSCLWFTSLILMMIITIQIIYMEQMLIMATKRGLLFQRSMWLAARQQMWNIRTRSQPSTWPLKVIHGAVEKWPALENSASLTGQTETSTNLSLRSIEILASVVQVWLN